MVVVHHDLAHDLPPAQQRERTPVLLWVRPRYRKVTHPVFLAVVHEIGTRTSQGFDQVGHALVGVKDGGGDDNNFLAFGEIVGVRRAGDDAR